MKMYKMFNKIIQKEIDYILSEITRRKSKSPNMKVNLVNNIRIFQQIFEKINKDMLCSIFESLFEGQNLNNLMLKKISMIYESEYKIEELENESKYYESEISFETVKANTKKKNEKFKSTVKIGEKTNKTQKK